MKKSEYTEGLEALDNPKKFAGAILQANPKKKKKQLKNPLPKERAEIRQGLEGQAASPTLA
ncbi:MAG TPA: hypothetical protein VMX38_18335 [Verrucomicrobiae bacterium]|jgi:hypothetical protein|nr:hypothetical protein [Verrucomicrobiae bacterium]